MHDVEDAFGVPLFHRGKNRIELTDTGEVAVEQARSLLSEAEKAVETVQTFERNQHTITIHSCAPVPLWSLLPELSRRFPDNIISSKLTNMDEILQNVVPAMLISVFFHSPVQIKIFSASLILRNSSMSASRKNTNWQNIHS